MRRAYTWMPEKGTQTPSPSPDLFPAKNGDKTLTRNSHAVWYIVRGHAKPTEPPPADPHVRWWGRGEWVTTPPMPICAHPETPAAPKVLKSRRLYRFFEKTSCSAELSSVSS